jgi:hypothetical protein
MGLFETKMAWFNSEERIALQRAQADYAASRSAFLFLVLAVPCVALVFLGAKLEGWPQYVVYGVAAVLGIILIAKHIPLSREHAREVERIDEEGLARYIQKDLSTRIEEAMKEAKP